LGRPLYGGVIVRGDMYRGVIVRGDMYRGVIVWERLRVASSILDKRPWHHDLSDLSQPYL
jgi:hypothetical protein